MVRAEVSGRLSVVSGQAEGRRCETKVLKTNRENGKKRWITVRKPTVNRSVNGGKR